MCGNINEVYTVRGLSGFQSIESLRAIDIAKSLAVKTKECQIVELNGNAKYKIDKKGNLIAA
jgi:hypothetical protein